MEAESLQVREERVTRGRMPIVGILGGGQLGRMIALAAHAMGISVVLLDPDREGSAAQVVCQRLTARLDDLAALRQLAALTDVITYENEWLDWQLLERLESSGAWVLPTSTTLRHIQDKYLQRTRLVEAGLPVPRFRAVASLADLEGFAREQNAPVVLKTRLQGYDGRGVRIVHSSTELVEAWEALCRQPLLVEAFVPFERELAVMVARSTTGEVRTYPVVETRQQHNVCHTVIAPADLSEPVRHKAEQIAAAAVEAFAGIGIFGIELFLEADGRLSINELAPRPHNSGHYTQDACLTDQFEQHLRAIFGFPLGETTLGSGAVAMVNILGERDEEDLAPDLTGALAVPGVRVHWYGKPQSRFGRKLGHINALGPDRQTALERALEARRLLEV